MKAADDYATISQRMREIKQAKQDSPEFRCSCCNGFTLREYDACYVCLTCSATIPKSREAAPDTH